MPEEVHSEKTGSLEDVDDAVRVLESIGDAPQGAFEEMRFQRGERRRP